jgi:hypothetical protein
MALSAVGCDEAVTSPDHPTPPSVAEAQSTSARQAISGVLFVSDVLARPDESVTPGGTTRYRGSIFEVTMTGDLEGEFVWEQVSNWNKYGNGALIGKNEGTLSWNGLTGGISGTAAISTNDFYLSGTWVFHGDGELDGHKIQITAEGPLGCAPATPCVYSGFVTVPASAR